MKVLVTGGTGQLGRALISSAPANVQLWAPDRAALDLADGEQLLHQVGHYRPDLVINAGAYTAVDRAEEEPDLARCINAAAPAALAQALREQGHGRLLQVSTDFVFDGAASRPYQPDDTRNPLSVYGKTKADGEDAAGEDAIILRTSWVYAENGTNFVLTMLRLMREQARVRVVADQIGAPSWAADIARTIWRLADLGRAGVYHHRDGGQTSWHGFVQAIAEEAVEIGLLDQAPVIEAIATSEFPTAARRPAYSVLDDSSTRSLLGDQTAPWRDNLKRMLEEVKALG